MFSEWDFKQDGEAATGGIGEVQSMVVAVELLQPGLRVCEPNAFSDNGARIGIRRDARPIVCHLNLKKTVQTPRFDLDPARSGTRGNAVPDRILDDWLQDQIWQSRIQGLRLDVQLYREPLSEADALNFEIAFQKLEL